MYMKQKHFDIGEVFDRVGKMFKDPDKTTAEYINGVTGKLHLPGLTFKLKPKEEGWYEIYPHPANPVVGYGQDEKNIVSVYIPGLFIGEIKEEKNIIYLKLKKDEER